MRVAKNSPTAHPANGDVVDRLYQCKKLYDDKKQERKKQKEESVTTHIMLSDNRKPTRLLHK